MIKTHLKNIDNKIIGFTSGELVVIGSRPGIGKTRLIETIIANNYDNHDMLYVSLESTEQMVYKRLSDTVFNMSLERYPDAKEGDEEYIEGSAEAEGYLRKSVNVVNYHHDPDRFKRFLPEYIRINDYEIVFLDYLQLFWQEGVDQYSVLSDLSRFLKNTAMDFDIPIVVTTQLNRNIEKRCPMIPNLSAFRDSGTIEENADIVFALNRREFYDQLDQPGLADLYLLKDRNGESGCIPLEFLRGKYCCMRREVPVDVEACYFKDHTPLTDHEKFLMQQKGAEVESSDE